MYLILDVTNESQFVYLISSEDISDTLGVLTSLHEFEFMLHCIFLRIYMTGIFVCKLASRFLF